MLSANDQPIVTDAYRVRLRPDGVILITWTPKLAIDTATASGAVDACEAAAGGTPRGLLVDMRDTGPMDRGARAVFASQRPMLRAVALWVESPLSVVVANFFLGIMRTAVPTRLFTSEPDALAWLAETAPDDA